MLRPINRVNTIYIFYIYVILYWLWNNALINIIFLIVLIYSHFCLSPIFLNQCLLICLGNCSPCFFATFSSGRCRSMIPLFLCASCLFLEHDQHLGLLTLLELLKYYLLIPFSWLLQGKLHYSLQTTLRLVILGPWVSAWFQQAKCYLIYPKVHPNPS